MCLEYVTQTFLGCSTNVVNGYKVFRYNSNTKVLYGSSFGENRLKTGKWLQEKDFRPNCGIHYLHTPWLVNYYVGWHMFTRLKDARAWRKGLSSFQLQVIHKCKGRRIVAEGTQEGMNVNVFKELLIGARIR